MRVMPYHHGNLRRVAIDAAVETIAADGPSALNLRELARRIGVSHAALTHHFGDRTGLLTAIAIEGFERLADSLSATWERTSSFLEVGVSYVGFAVRNPGHFAVMFRGDLVQPDDPTLVAAQERSSALLYGPLESVAGSTRDDARTVAGIAAWSLVHGLATLWLQGSLPRVKAMDAEALTRAAARHLFTSA
jgi:AcrR family transcriptional regulator